MLYRYKILAFIVWHKNRRTNSCVYKHEKKYLLAKECGISPNTYSSYFQSCIQFGILNPSGEGYVFKSLSDCIITLFGEEEEAKDILKKWKHRRFWRGEEEITNFKSVYEQVKFSVFKQNYKQQLFFLERKKRALSIARNGIRLKSELKFIKQFAKTQLNINSSDTDVIVKRIRCMDKAHLFCRTGKNHLSNLLGVSAATAVRLMKNWSKDKRIIRIINYFYSGIDSTKTVNKHLPNYFIKGNQWVKALGSEVRLTSI